MAYTDSFIGVDGTEISAHNSSWSANAGLKIQDNALQSYGNAFLASRYNSGTFAVDQYSEAVGVGITPSIRSGVFVRGATSPASDSYFVLWGTSQCLLYKLIAYGQTLLRNVSGWTATPSDVVRLTALGEDLIINKNGAHVWTEVGAADQLSGGKPGILFVDNGGRSKNWSGGDETGATGGPIAWLMQHGQFSGGLL